MPGEPLTELIRDLAETVHQTGSLRDHADPNDRTGWNVHGIETCEDPLCVEALAFLAAPEQEAVTRALRSIREQVEPVRALSEAAWPGPWIANENGHSRWIHAAPSSVVIADFDPNAGAVAPDPNARFAAAAVNLVRDLLAILERPAGGDEAETGFTSSGAPAILPPEGRSRG